ncbi:PHD finger protein 20 isoform X2 [Planococcus citri]|uniref:PHD finger protein 20 isoform X2 n=1 Tax=Planococcus citri TaxID=170843 RepID=UPI0031F8261F
MACEDAELIDFDNDVIEEGDPIYIYDVLNNSWKKSTALEVDSSDHELLVKYEDSSQEWVRMDGPKMCRCPPPPPPPKPQPLIPPPIVIKSESRAVEKPALPKKAERPKTNLKTITKAKATVSSKPKSNSKKSGSSHSKKIIKKLEDYITGGDDESFPEESLDEKNVPTESPVTPSPSPFPRLRLLPKSSSKMEQYRKKKEQAKKKSPLIDNPDAVVNADTKGTPVSSKSLKAVPSKSGENEKEVTKFKVRFGKAPDLNPPSRKKSKPRNEDMFEDVNVEMSVVINDEKLPSGWSKHMIKRKTSKKWDIVIQNEDERKFRSRADLKAYFEGINQPYPDELFDFSSGKRTPHARTPAAEKSDDLDTNESISFLSNKRKIKTLLPRRSVPEIQCSTPLPKPEPVAEHDLIQPTVAVAACTPTPISTPAPPTPEAVSPLVLTPLPAVPALPASPVLSASSTSASGSGFTCPKQDCKKHYRSESLLMMHIKHYHREYKSLLKSMPNVADLAYARTVGESIDSPQSALLEKITRIEEDRMKEKTDDAPIIDEDFTLQIEPDDETTLSASDKSANSLLKVPKKSTLFEKTMPSPTPASPSASTSVLLAQLKQPPLVPPPISIQAEYTDAELSVSQNSPIALYSPKVTAKDVNKSSPLSETDSGRKSASPRKRRVSQLDAGEVINCTCGYGFEDGLMMQCDLCLCWQHGACNSVENEEDTPSPYICVLCQNPRRIHSSKKYVYTQNWMKDGKIPRYEFSKTTDEIQAERESLIQRTQGFLCNLADLRNAVFGLLVKVHILKQSPDHPKLYLWAQSWTNKKSEEKENLLVAESGPVPEAAINMADCRKHLSEHIDEEIEKAEAILQDIEEKIDNLEKDDDFENDSDRFKSVAKHMLLMMLRDLSSIQNLKYCS